MCLCHEFNKRFSSNGLYHGRPVLTKDGKYVTKAVSPQVMVKHPSQSFYKKGK